MNSIIMKFGGTSLEGATAFQNAARIVAERIERRPVVVVSAMARFTDALIASVKQATESGADTGLASLEKHFERHLRVIDALLSREADRLRQLVEQSRTEIKDLLNTAVATEQNEDRRRRKALTDAVASNGERLSAALLAAVLLENNYSACDVDARHCVITDDEFGCAAPLMTETFASTQAQLQSLIDSACVPVLGGFIGATLTGETTTLGRGGSDYTAPIIGAALDSREIQIWTDVPGVLTADPRVAPKARTVPRLSFAEASELAYLGARVLHRKPLHPAVERDIPVRICNSRAPDGRSTVVVGESEMSPQTVKAIAHKTGVTTVQITSARMLGAYGFLRAIFEIFDKYRTAVDVVTTSEVSVSLSLDDTTALPTIVAELEKLGN